jgi:hypothetical protein
MMWRQIVMGVTPQDWAISAMVNWRASYMRSRYPTAPRRIGAPAIRDRGTRMRVSWDYYPVAGVVATRVV